MAAVSIRLKPKTLANLHSLRHFSSSSSSSSDSDGELNSHNGDESNPAPSSYFGDIKARLRQSQPTQRRIPLNPPKPDVLSSSAPKAASLEEIRSKLAEFRSRSAPPSPSSTPIPISFHDLYKSTVGEKEGQRADRFAFDGIRETLKQLREKNPAVPGQGGGAGGAFARGTPSLSLKNIKERLSKIQEESSSRSSPLPKSIFGKELEKEEGTAPKERKTDFWTEYTYEELGEKLRMLRPGEAEKGKKAAKGSLSLLNEMNERLVKLRVLEEKAADSKIGGAFKHLKDSLVKLKESENQKKMSAQKHSILAHFTGFGPPEYMFSPPKEDLVEKYFHLDLMSSQEKMKLELQKVRDDFKMSESDCGSARVQVAQLTTKIKHLSTVLHKKDKHSLKGLQAMVQRRKKLLSYLRRTDWDSYSFVLSKLGLRDIADHKA